MRPDLQDLLHASFARRTGRTLSEVAGSTDLYHASAVVLMHGTQADPIFCFANLSAQRLWGYTWDDFITLPSRQSAEAEVQVERERLLARARADGFIDDYAGVRIARDGRRFRISGVILWNVDDEMGTARGQAAVFMPTESSRL